MFWQRVPQCKSSDVERARTMPSLCEGSSNRLEWLRRVAASGIRRVKADMMEAVVYDGSVENDTSVFMLQAIFDKDTQ